MILLSRIWMRNRKSIAGNNQILIIKKLWDWTGVWHRPCELVMGLGLVMCLYLTRNAGLDDRVLTPAAAGPSHWSADAGIWALIGQFEYYLVSYWTYTAIKWSARERLLPLHWSKNLIENFKIPKKDLLITKHSDSFMGEGRRPNINK